MNNKLDEQWFVQTSQGQLGPYSFAQLRQFAAKDAINRSTLLRPTSANSWIRAEQIPSIFSDAPLPLAAKAKVVGPPQLPSVAKKTSSIPSSATLNSPTAMLLVGAAVGVPIILVMLCLIIIFSSKTSPPDSANDLASAAQTPITPSTPPATPTSASSNSESNINPATTTSQTPAIYLSTEELVNRTKESVAIIATPVGSGSGFVVQPGVVVTNYHVISNADADSIKVIFADGPAGQQGPFHAQIIAESPDRDLALLKVNSKAQPLTFDENPRFRRGQDVVIIGSPGVAAAQDILPNAVTKGLLSSEVMLNGLNHYQLGLAVNSGNSGGPVLGMDGNIVGVVVSKSTAEEAIGFCIPASELLSMLQSQAKLGFAPTEIAKSQHNARRVVSATLEQAILLSGFINGMEQILSADVQNASTVSARDAAKIIQEKQPDLATDYSPELTELLKDSQLSARQRSDVNLLTRRYQMVQALLARPQGSFAQFHLAMNRMLDQYVEQLAAVNRSLELGRPELFE